MADRAANKRIAKNTLFLYIRMGLVMFISLYTTRVVLNVLGVVDYGIYNVVCGFVSMFNVFNTCLTTGTNRYYNYAIGKKEENGVQKVFNASIRIQLILLLLVVILIESVGLWYINNKMVIPLERLNVANWIFQYAVFSLIVLMFQTPYSAAVLAYEKMDFYAIVGIVDVLLKLGFVLLLKFVSYDKLLFYGVLMTVVSLVNFLMYYIYVRNMFKEVRFSLFVDKPTFKSLFSFTAWSLLDPITLMLKGQGSNMVLNLFFGPIVNAAYGISQQISNAIDGFTSNLSIAFRPQIIQSYSSGDYYRTKNLMYGMSKINFIFHSILIIPVLFELDFLLNLWLGNDYPAYTIPFTIFILFIATLNCLHAPISTVMVATGKIKRIKTISLLIIGSVVPIGYFLFKVGLAPTAIFVLLTFLTVINILVGAYIMSQEFPIVDFKDYLKTIFLPCVLFLVAILIIPFAISHLIPSSWYRLFFLAIISTVVAVIIGYRFVLNNTEKNLAKSLLKGFSSLIKK